MLGVGEHVDLCVRGIQESVDPVAKLWNRQLRDGEWASTLGTEEITSTLICLIGTDRWDPKTWTDLGLRPEDALSAAARRLGEVPYPGGVGLLVWANALYGDVDLRTRLREIGPAAEEWVATSTALTSMEASWLLSGLLHENSRRPSADTQRLAEAVQRDLHARFDESSGVMPHATRRAGLAHVIRRHVANFAWTA